MVEANDRLPVIAKTYSPDLGAFKLAAVHRYAQRTAVALLGTLWRSNGKPPSREKEPGSDRIVERISFAGFTSGLVRWYSRWD